MFHLFEGPVPVNRFKPFGMSGDCTNVINSANFYFDQSRVIGLAGTRICRVSVGKLGRP
jgi:hypothetical protein